MDPDRDKQLVVIKYWVQDTMESGHWEKTGGMTRETARLLLYQEMYERPEIEEI